MNRLPIFCACKLITHIARQKPSRMPDIQVPGKKDMDARYKRRIQVGFSRCHYYRYGVERGICAVGSSRRLKFFFFFGGGERSRFNFVCSFGWIYTMNVFEGLKLNHSRTKWAFDGPGGFFTSNRDR